MNKLCFILGFVLGKQNVFHGNKQRVYTIAIRVCQARFKLVSTLLMTLLS